MNGFAVPALGALVAAGFVCAHAFYLMRARREQRQVARVRRPPHDGGRR